MAMQGRAVRPLQGEIWASYRTLRRRLDDLKSRTAAAVIGDLLFEAVEPRQHGLPFGKLRIGLDEIRECSFHAPEGRRRLHQAAEADRAGKVGRPSSQDRHDHLQLAVARRKEGQPLLAPHDRRPIFLNQGEATHQPLALGGLALEEGNLFGVLANAQKVRAQVGLAALLLDIEADQWLANPMHDSRCRRPHRRKPAKPYSREAPGACPKSVRGAASESPHRIQTKEARVTTAPMSPVPRDRV